MEVDELLTFKPELGLQSGVEVPIPAKEKKKKNSSSAERNPRKRTKFDAPRRSGTVQPPQKEAIAAIQRIASNHISVAAKVEKQAAQNNEALIAEKLKELEKSSDQEPLDEVQLRKLILSFEKRVLKNQELRIKFPDDPKKFMESEIELNEAVEEMHVIATVPDLYSILVEQETVKTFISLLSHENTDISIAMVDLLQEMTDVNTEEVSEDVQEFVDALVEFQMMATLVHNLQRLDETRKIDSDGFHNTLGIIENLFELKPDICSEANSSGLLAWLLKHLKSKVPFNANKLYSSEILAICLQTTEENKRVFPSVEGIDVILQQLAHYKRHDPPTAEEQEFMENLFDALSSCLLLPSNREPFLVGEGLQLMNLMLREKKLSRNGALRVLDHALCGPHGADNCNKFIDILGLRTIFPLFMKTPKKHGTKGLSKEQHEEHVISIISSLLKNAKSNQRQRLVGKFTENDHEKVDRLLELHFKYLDKVLVTNSQLEEQARKENIDEDEVYLRRLDGGLFSLQLLDYIMLDICASGTPTIKQRVLKILNVRNASVKTIKNVIREYASNLGDENTSDHVTAEQDRILDLLDKFQNM